MIKKYTKKPVEVEAIQLNFGNLEECLKFSNGKINPKTGDFEIQTLEGVMTAQSGDYIIKGAKGEFYLCKSDVFKLTYSEKIGKSLGDFFNQTPPFNPNQGIPPNFNPPTTGPDSGDFWYGGYMSPKCDAKPPHLAKFKYDTSIKKSKEQDDGLNRDFQQMVEELIEATK